MLGRTDSRRRLLFLLIVFAVGSMALIARTAYWQVLSGDFLLARAAAQTTVRDRGRRPPGRHLRPDGHGPACDDRRPRPARRGSRPAGTRPGCATADRDELVRILKLDRPRTPQTLRDQLDSRQPYIVIARGIEPSVAERIRQALREKRIVERLPRSRA